MTEDVVVLDKKPSEDDLRIQELMRLSFRDLARLVKRDLNENETTMYTFSSALIEMMCRGGLQTRKNTKSNLDRWLDFYSLQVRISEGLSYILLHCLYLNIP